MTVHVNRTHHRPRVAKAPGTRSRWSFPWKVSCDCGFRAHEMTWHGAWVDALTHSQVVR